MLNFLEVVGEWDTEVDFEETRCMSDLVAPLQLANVVNGRHEKARDGRYELTLENKIWLHVALVDNPSGTGLEHWRLVLNFSATRA